MASKAASDAREIRCTKGGLQSRHASRAGLHARRACRPGPGTAAAPRAPHRFGCTGGPAGGRRPLGDPIRASCDSAIGVRHSRRRGRARRGMAGAYRGGFASAAASTCAATRSEKWWPLSAHGSCAKPFHQLVSREPARAREMGSVGTWYHEASEQQLARAQPMRTREIRARACGRRLSRQPPGAHPRIGRK